MGLACDKQSYSGQKAGQMFQEAALAVMCIGSSNANGIEIVKAMLAAGTDPNKCDTMGLSPLMHASKSGHIDIMNTLLSHGADVTYCNGKGQSSLLLACENKQWQAAQLLYGSGADAFHFEGINMTPFSTAIKNHGVAFVQSVAEKDEVAMEHLINEVSMHNACKSGYSKVVEQFNLKLCSKDDLLQYVHAACKYGHLTVLQILLGNDQTISFETILAEACKYGHSDIVNFLLSKQKYVYKQITSLILSTYKAGHIECMNVLIKYCRGMPGLSLPEVSLNDACRDNLVELVEFLVDIGVDVDKAQNGNPALCSASMEGNFDIVKVLINGNASPYVKDSKGFSPLIHACLQNHEEVVDYLLQWYPESVNNVSVETPLTASCRKGHMNIVMKLLDVHPELSLANKEGKSPLQVSIEAHQPSIAKILVRKGASPNEFSGTRKSPLWLAYDCGQYDIVRFLLDNNVDYTRYLTDMTFGKICLTGHLRICQDFLKLHNTGGIDGKEPLVSAVQADSPSVLQLILSSDKVKKSQQDLELAMRCACIAGLSDIVQILVSYEKSLVNTCTFRDTPLFLATQNNHKDIVAFLLQHDADPNIGICSVSAATERGYVNILRLILQYDIDQSRLNKACLSACKNGNSKAVELLLNKLADVSFSNEEKMTFLLAATWKCSTEIVKLLLSNEANPNIADSNNHTPLYVACFMDHAEIASLLLDAGADTNVGMSNSPLWTACIKGNIDIVCLLLKNRADPNQTDNKGQHLVQVAHNHEQHEVVRLLLEHQADPSILQGVGLSKACQLGYGETALFIKKTH